MAYNAGKKNLTPLYVGKKKLYLQRFGREKFLHKPNHPNLRSGPVFSLTAIIKSSLYPLECFLQRETKIEPDLGLRSPIPH